MDSRRYTTAADGSTRDETTARWEQEWRLGEQFAVSLFKQSAAANLNANTVLSPLSVLVALCLLYNGAAGETKQLMAKVLGIDLIRDADLDKTLRKLILQLNSRTDDSDIKLVNSLWMQNGLWFKDEYINRSVEAYSSSLYNVDFVNQRDEAARLINEWVSNATNKVIPQIIEAGQLSQALLIIANAIYFKAAWLEQFPKEQTLSAPFYLTDGTKIQMPTMTIDHRFEYRRSPDHEALILPYKDRRYTMVILLPSREVSLKSFLQSIQSSYFCSDFGTASVLLKMPRFEIDFFGDLVSPLKSLGLDCIFAEPDFSAICQDQLRVGQVLHRARLKVDEEGSVAAAATAVMMLAAGAASSPMILPRVEMTVDRSFVAAICERQNKVFRILFLGSVVDPRVGS